MVTARPTTIVWPVLMSTDCSPLVLWRLKVANRSAPEADNMVGEWWEGKGEGRAMPADYLGAASRYDPLPATAPSTESFPEGPDP